MTPTNLDRAGWAAVALKAFARSVDGWSEYNVRQQSNPEDRIEVVTDLVADLMHYCDEFGLDWSNVLRTATAHYDEEARHG